MSLISDRIGAVSMVAAILGGLGLVNGLPAAAQETEVAIVLDIRDGEAPDECDATRPQVRIATSGQTAEGILTVELYDDNRREFLSSEGRLRRARVPAENGLQTICFDIDAPGTYAVAGYHDVDGDRKLDKKWNRIPKEPFGLSNDPPLKLRKPRHKESAFEAAELGADIELKLYRR